MRQLTGWCVLAVLLALALFYRWPGPGWLQTDIRSLLPATSLQPLADRAVAQRASRYENQLIVVASAAQRDAARAMLRQVEQTLAAGGWIDQGFELQQARQWQALAQQLYPHRRQLLTPQQLRQLADDPDSYLEAFRRRLYAGPGVAAVGNLVEDPAGLFQHYLRAATPAPPRLRGATAATDRVTVYRLFTLSDQRYGFFDRQALYTLYLDLKREAAARDVELLLSGAPLYAAYGAQSAAAEMTTIGLASLSLLALLLLLVWRGVAGLALTLGCVAAGLAGGWAVTIIVFQTLHIFTLVFGATLIGIAADYALHYLSHSLGEGWQRAHSLHGIARSLVLGVASSATAFAALLLLPFPGLQQVGLFMAVGLLCSFATVVLLFPTLYRGPGKHRRAAQLLPGRRVSVAPLKLAAGVLLLALPGLLLLQPVDDVRDFYAAPAGLLADEAVITQSFGGGGDSRFVLVTAADAQAVLELEERLLAEAAALAPPTGPSLAGISQLVPSLRRQRQSQTVVAGLYRSAALQTHRALLGLPADTGAQGQKPGHDAWLTPADIAAADLPAGIGSYLGCAGDVCASWLPLSDASVTPELQAVLGGLPGVSLEDPVADINALLRDYRQSLLLALAVGLALVGILLAVVAGPGAMLRVILLPLLSAVISLSLLGYLGGAYTIVNVMALVLILGVGLDYAVFRTFTAASEQRLTALAITLSALTSIAAFGMLSWSETPVISQFGRSIMIGLIAAYGLSWLDFGRGREGTQ